MAVSTVTRWPRSASSFVILCSRVAVAPTSGGKFCVSTTILIRPEFHYSCPWAGGCDKWVRRRPYQLFCPLPSQSPRESTTDFDASDSKLIPANTL